MTLKHCVFRSVTGQASNSHAGIARVPGGKVVAEYCEFHECGDALYSSAFYVQEDGQATFLGCLFAENKPGKAVSAGDSGFVLPTEIKATGTVASVNSVTFTDCRFERNANGGLVIGGGTATISNCVFDNNNVGDNGHGGDIMIWGDSTEVIISGCTFKSSVPTHGRMIWCGTYKNVTVNDCTFAVESSARSNANGGSSICICTNDGGLSLKSCGFKGQGVHFETLGGATLNIRVDGCLQFDGSEEEIASSGVNFTGGTVRYNGDPCVWPPATPVATKAPGVTTGGGSGSGSGSDGLSGGAVAGVVVGVIITVALVSVAIVWMIGRKKSDDSGGMGRQPDGAEMDTDGASMGGGLGTAGEIQVPNYDVWNGEVMMPRFGADDDSDVFASDQGLVDDSD